jgi:ribosomal protein S18 acetylase RimI-like enzyme
MSDLSADFVSIKKMSPQDLKPIVDDATLIIGQIADKPNRSNLTERIQRVLKNDSDIIVILRDHRPIGLIAFRANGNEALLTFGHATPYGDKWAQDVLRTAIDALAGRGFRIIMSTFNWPAREAFDQAAAETGFARVERMDMNRECDPSLAVLTPPDDIEIKPWLPEYFDAAATIQFENSFPEDQIINPQSKTLDGSRRHLQNIIDNHYGEFSSDQSSVALHNGKPVGFLLTSVMPGGGFLIVELAVDHNFRGRGIANCMVQKLIRGNDSARKPIELTVTLSNREAVRLYERSGFRVKGRITYHILEIAD